jgi:hypothetical protein
MLPCGQFALDQDFTSASLAAALFVAPYYYCYMCEMNITRVVIENIIAEEIGCPITRA